jgi:hypothetical protein
MVLVEMQTKDAEKKRERGKDMKSCFPIISVILERTCTDIKKQL